MNSVNIIKYPSTMHLEGSSLQTGDSVDVFKFNQLKGKYLVIEEKIDGANSGISFSSDAELLMQSRGHYLLGHDKPHFDLFKTFCKTFENDLFDILTDRYIMYGEWMYALHSIYYNLLPDYFFEFDIYDKYEKVFLSTIERKKIISKAKNVKIFSVPVLFEGSLKNPKDMLDLIDISIYKDNNAIHQLEKEMLEKRYPKEVFDSLLKLNESMMSEGLYIKVESEKTTDHRLKYVRKDFTQTILDNDLHWNSRPMIVNQVIK